MLSVVLSSLTYPELEPFFQNDNAIDLLSNSSSSAASQCRINPSKYASFPADGSSSSSIPFLRRRVKVKTSLRYEFYGDKCPNAERIIRSTMADIFSNNKKAPAQLLRLMFHDCFNKGCDASVLLDETTGNRTHPAEKTAIPNKTLRGFDFVEKIKEELERSCPGTVSCSDIIVIATRDAINMAGGPFYPVFTGRRDSTMSHFNKALTDIPGPDGNISVTLRKFSLRGFNPRETVALLGGHNIGKIGCEFVEPRISNFTGTGKPDPTLPSDFRSELSLLCSKDDVNAATPAPSPVIAENTIGGSRVVMKALSIPSGSEFGSKYYQRLMQGRGLLFADQQLLANDETAQVVRTYASDSMAFRIDFAKAMIKMSNLEVLTGSEGEVRLICSRNNNVNDTRKSGATISTNFDMAKSLIFLLGLWLGKIASV